jgi:predicted lipid-binding transport protein (Tim44 family)
METPTSTRELIGDDKAENDREPRRFEREPGEPTDERRDADVRTRDADVRDDERAGATAATRDTTERSGTAGFAAGASTTADDSPELLPRDQNEGFQRRWEQIQTGFVDEPRQTVEQADELVAEVMKRLAEGFATERERLEGQWGRGEDVSTEDLRIALQRYRGFFQRLLSA